ncbi:hypothetical protein KDA_75980 [Dictyobacter alpinus]|uniref:Uncharacterized protein n=1 Tax=Dictyobacter alpinus TaxID=2014873 RepID=A0A402BL90_9CHLR|nr:hypothetical protein [Dictyobacter alpinus]GCE32114.1 hypothetical protein KDA_75980 [Dictyobacter alpinus]
MQAVFPASQLKDISSAHLPKGFCPEGVAQTCFDSDLLYLIEHAIPPSINGLKIFAHLLYHATLDPRTSMQHSLFQATGECGDEAIVLIHSIEALARTETSPCAPETYHKVLLAFEAMQIIRRKFHRTYTEIRIPVGKRTIHVPSLLTGLQKMYKKHGNEKGTNKFQKFALRVATRLQSGEFSRYASSGDVPHAHQAIAQVLLSFLKEHHVKEVRVPSLNEACELIVQAIQTGRVGSQSGESVRLTIQGSKAKVGESFAPVGEFVVETSGGQMSTTQEAGEFVGMDSPTLPTFRIEKGKKRRETRRLCLKKGEPEAIFVANSPEFANLESISADLGEFAAAVSFSDHISSEIITCNKEITINDDTPTNSPVYKDPRPIEAIRHEAADLAQRLDGSRDSRWFARFVKTVQIYPPRVRRLAEIDVLYHSAFPDYRGKPDRPGAVFFKRCEEYANPQCKVIDQIRQWDESGMSFKDIRQELQRGRPVPSAAMLPFLDEQPIFLQSEGLEDGPERQDDGDDRQHLQPSWQENREMVQSSLLNTRMNQKQANVLCQQIRQEVQVFCDQARQQGQAFDIQAEVYPGERDGEFVVVTFWKENGEETEEEWVNPASWSRYFEQVKKCYLK